MTYLRFFIMCISMLFSTSALADYQSQKVAGWDIFAADNNQCFMVGEFEGAGGSVILLGISQDGENYLGVLNSKWSITKGEELQLDYFLTRGVYSDHASIGIESDGKRGFATKFETKFPQYFAQSESLVIIRNGVVVDRLSLKGSALAMVEVLRCLRESNNKGIPVDPFAR